jgi:hypothetical protein
VLLAIVDDASVGFVEFDKAFIRGKGRLGLGRFDTVGV